MKKNVIGQDVKFDDLYWHDGLIRDFHIVVENHAVKMIAKFEIYPSESARERIAVELHFKEISSYQITIDSEEIIDNCRAGNIAYAFSKIKNNHKVYRYLFFVGYLEVVAKKLDIIVL